MIKLYPIGTLKFTVFDEQECLGFLREHDIELTSRIQEADVFILRELDLANTGEITQWLNEHSPAAKPVLLWTHEPRFCKTDQHLIEIDQARHLHVMNLYTRNVHLSNFTFYGKNIDQVLRPVSGVKFSATPVAALATWVDENKQAFLLNGTDIDLSVKRQRLIYDAHRHQIAHVYGRRWPSSISTGESRGTGWHNNKLAILKNYQFNIAMENTAFDYYCTEKIWDSIKSYCLPVYSSYNNRISDIFPAHSYIDFDAFQSNEDIISYIKNMYESEYIRRLNICIEVYNDLFLRVDSKWEKQRALEKIKEKITSIMSQAASR